MKTVVTVAATLAFGGVAFAQEAPTPAATSTPAASARSEEELAAEAQARIDALKAQLEDTVRRIEASAEKEEALLVALNEIGREASERTDELSRVQVQISDREKAVEEAREAIGVAALRVDANKAYLRKRLRSIYMHGRVSMLEVIFSARTYNDLVRRTRFHSKLAASDATRISTLRTDLAHIEEREENLDLDLSLLRELESEARTAKEAISLQYQYRQSLLEKVRGERGLLLAAARQLEASTRELTQVMEAGNVAELAPLMPRVSFKAQKGSLLRPVEGPIGRQYGKYRHPTSGATLFYHGVEFRVAVGTDIRAVASGRVVLASNWFSQYGKILVVDHGDGYHTLYAHNSQIFKEKGDAVTEAEVIAQSGDTASLDGPKLYFAIFHHGADVNPEDWLLPYATDSPPAPAP